MSFCFINGAGRELNAGAGAPKIRADAERLNVPDKSYNNILTVNKNHIDRELHKKHMDRTARRDQHAFAIRQRSVLKQADHSSDRRIGEDSVIRENGIACLIKDAHRKLRTAEHRFVDLQTHGGQLFVTFRDIPGRAIFTQNNSVLT